MYLYQLMLSKQWLMLEEDEASSSSYYQPKPTRIKHFYDCGYDDIVKQLVNQPQSCKDFYSVLQQVGLPYQRYYDKIPDKVSNTLKMALHQEHVVLVQLPVINGYSGTPSYSHDIKPIPIVKKEPTFEPDDSWLVVDLLNHKPELIQILDASNNHQVTTAQTSPNQIFLKHSDVFSPSKVLPKVHIVLGGLGGSHDLALRGDKPLRVKQLAQSWLDELSTLLASGNSPFTIELDEAMASLINQKALPQRGLQAKYIDEHTAFRPDETVGVFFYHMLAILNHTNFITARQRIGICGADESEGAIPDVKSLKQALKSLHNIRHSDGQDKPDYAYHSDTLSKTANHYLSSPIVLDGTGGDNDALSALMTQVKQATEQDQLTDIESLYANAIKLLKHLREPGIIRHVETRREYQLKATKLDYRYIDNRQIRIYAEKLLKCADTVCEKHLYHDDIKQAFRQDIQYFANDIVNQVDNGSITYEHGVQKIKKEEDRLWEQSFQWLTNGLSIFGGIGMVMAGWALCSTGIGCLIGAPLILHGGNSVYEGTVGVSSGIANVIDGKNRDLNINGPLRQVYQSSAAALGFDASVGSLTYDLVDLGISIHGKLKLMPKLNEFGDPKFKLFVYGRQDLERAYLQMSRKLLSTEIFSDTLSLINVYEDFKKAFVLDSDTQQVSMAISEPEKISNVKDIIDDCSLVVTITGTNEDTPGYYLCERVDGSKYKKDYLGNITEGGLTH